MNPPKRIVGIVGSYRKGSMIDSAVSEILSAAAQCGAEVSKIYLADAYVEFCTNCRSCTQEAGSSRGRCVINDDMHRILDQIDGSQGLVLGSPVNFGDVTALTKRFQERLVCHAYWPWGTRPVLRNRKKDKKAVLVTSSAAPAFWGRLMFKSLGTLKRMAGILGAKPVGTLYVGLADEKDPKLPDRAVKKARMLGKRLAS